MKKIIVFACLVLASTLSFAQTLDEIRAITKPSEDWDPVTAKDAIDKYQTNPKNAKDANGYYYKGIIYNKYSKDPELKNNCLDCKMQAFQALQKAKELDKKNPMIIMDGSHTFLDIYNGLYQSGVDAYNTRNYPVAFTNFTNTIVVGDYMRDNELAKIAIIDTPVILNAGLAEQADKKDSIAAIYFQKLADANVSGTAYNGIYEFLVYYYKSKKYDALYATALAQGKKLYPQDDYWKTIELSKATEGKTKDDLFKTYDNLLATDPSNYNASYDYSVELYNYVYANPDSTLKTASYKPRLYDQLKKTIAIKSTPEDNLMLARYLYNSSFDKSDAAALVKGGTPEITKKRRELYDGALSDMGECIPYAETAANYYAAITTLKPSEKDNYKASLIILASIYEAKKDKVKQALYAAKLKAIN